MKGTHLFQISSFLIAAFLALLLLVPDDAAGHGALWDPLSRSSMWHFYASYPPNYSETSLYCGGKDVLTFNILYITCIFLTDVEL